MIPLRVSFRPGVSLYEQVVYAAKKAVISGQMRPGDPFPSVRALSRELKINPNTAHKVVAHLVGEGLLEVLPGTGTVIAVLPKASSAERTQLLGTEIEQLVVQIRMHGTPQHRVSEGPGGHRLQLPVALVADGLRRFLE